ncbi:MAG: C40 family peptidase [Gilvibacter sp.]
MYKLLLIAFVGMFLTSCGSARKTSQKSTEYSKERTTKSSNNAKVNSVITYAKSFKGTRYKFGGTTSSGMDCSGLVYVAFKNQNVHLPRVSRDMATQGKRISLGQTVAGDLVFFKTSKSSRNINHVGLVVEAKNGNIYFIHSTTSRGVIISSLDERYWNSAFVEVRRII